MPLTPRQEDFGFTEGIRPFEVQGITVLDMMLLHWVISNPTLLRNALPSPSGVYSSIFGLGGEGGMLASDAVSYGKRKKTLNHSAMKSSNLQLFTFTVNCLLLSGFLILCCSHLDLDKGLGNCMALPT
jgi:hypothetical protein